MAKSFSVLLPVYAGDRASWLELSLDSVFDSNIRPNEIVIVKDGPLGKMLDAVIEKYEIKYRNLIKSVTLKENVGLGLALAKGLECCSNELIARMDADDICCRNRFEKQLKVFEDNPNVSIVGSNVTEYDESMQRILNEKIVPETDIEIKKIL